VGPDTFQEFHHKTDIFMNNDFTMDFYQVKTWEFKPEMSVGVLYDEIYTINIIALSAAESTRWPDSVVEGDFPFLRSFELL
jgi:hypothetical protein